MNIKYIRYLIVIFSLITSLFLLEAHAGKPAKVTVTAAVPNSALQGELTEVEIDGTGFDAGSTARFIVTDTRDDTQIDVTEVTFDSATGKLKAKIKVKDAALPVAYDIEVRTSSGRRGKGTTLFRVREKAGESDPCLTSTSPFPAFMFWRNMNSSNHPEYTIFLASEDGTCVRALVDVPDSSQAHGWHSAFSYDETINLGRVVWQRGSPEETWLQEFTVDLDNNGNGNTIVPPPDPELILVYPDDANMDVIAYSIPDIDISADLKNVAFPLFDVRLEGISSETHVVEIDACKGLNPLCTPGADTRILRDIQQYADRGPLWWRIAWDPLGDRIYLRQVGSGPEIPPQAVRMVTRSGDGWTDRDLFTTDEYPEYAWLSDVTSGISGDREKLALRHSGDCPTISVIDVADCEAGPTEINPRPCAAEAQFFGVDPSWTDRGTIIHTIGERGRLNKRIGRYICSFTIIGEGNPITSEVTPLVEGENPDAG